MKLASEKLFLEFYEVCKFAKESRQILVFCIYNCRKNSWKYLSRFWRWEKCKQKLKNIDVFASPLNFHWLVFGICMVLEVKDKCTCYGIEGNKDDYKTGETEWRRLLSFDTHNQGLMCDSPTNSWPNITVPISSLNKTKTSAVCRLWNLTGQIKCQ